MASTREAKLAEWRDGWPVVVACAFGITLYGAGYYALGTFIAPLEKEFGWSRAMVTSAFLVFAGVGMLMRPPIGMLIDKFGSRRLAVPGAILVGLGFASFSLLNGSMGQWLGLWLVMAVVCSLVTPSVWSVAIARNFVASRGLALSGMMLGSALGAIAAPLWSNHLINEYGWRSAYRIMGLGWGTLVAIVCFFLLLDRREQPLAGSTLRPAGAMSGYTVRDGVRSRAFILIVASILISNMLNMSLSVHMIPILTWDGVTRYTAVRIASSLGGSMIAGTMMFGLIGDRASPRILTAILVSIPVITCVLLLYPSDSVAVKAIAINAFGLSAGAQMASYTNLSARYYGMRSFGTLSSISGMATMFATAVAPFIAGVIFDATGGYTILLIAGVPILLTASLCLLSLSKEPGYQSATPPVGADQAIAATT